MAKEVLGLIKLQIPAGGANPSPPVGPALGQRGLNIMDFCKAFNDKTKDVEKGAPVPVIITAYKDRSFDFITKLPPVSYYLKKAAKIKKGNSTPGRSLVGKVTIADIEKIAKDKMQDLNAVKKILEAIDATKVYMPIDAIKILKENKYAKFNETLDVAINLGIDPNKTDQGIRGVTNLPKGTGKSIKIAVLTKGDKQTEAKEAGADLVGENELIESIASGKIAFDLLIASPDMMPSVGKVAKILGPKGLMPNPKLGTVTQDIATAVKNAKSGQVQFKNDKAGIVHAGIGKMNFDDNDLLENLKFFYTSINKSKPESVKGSFIKKVTIASTMGVGLEINASSLR